MEVNSNHDDSKQIFFLNNSYEIVLSTLSGYTLTAVSAKELSKLESLILRFFAKVSEWEEVSGEYKSWHKFSGFSELNKGRVKKILKALCFSALQTEYNEDGSLANEVTYFIRSSESSTAYAIFHGVLKLIAARRVQADLKSLFAEKVATDTMFGGSLPDSLNDIPF